MIRKVKQRGSFIAVAVDVNPIEGRVDLEAYHCEDRRCLIGQT